uniref:CCHC-type domain-containing protein n=1 Tax=Magallana gigas TaxID=29159 RepID=A0A8W8NPX7_MAGGI
MMSENITEEMLEVRAKLMKAPLEVLAEILKEFGEPVDSAKGRFKVAMQADRFFMKEMEGDQAQTPLLAVKFALESPGTSTDKTVKIEASNEPTSTKTESPSAVKLHKDFKISGQVDCKSGISYTSLIRQIETVPSSSLRSYLDGRPDINLATLRSILRGHYAEKNATELYSELASATQNPKETPNDFLLRVMDLRNRILFASQEDSHELKYSPELVAGLFRRTVYTGLRDTTLRHEMKAHLDNVKITDATLMHELNQITIQESERHNKLQAKHSVSQINSNSVEINAVKEEVKNDLASEIKSLRIEMTALKKMVEQSPNTAKAQPTPSRSGPRSCTDCQSVGRRCNHCWNCGGSGHRRQECPSKKFKLSGNSSGST